jgi:ABC-2 type transport system permease protein
MIWPIILGTLFSLAFSNIMDASKLGTINLGVVNNENYKNNEALSSTLTQLSNKNNKNYMFDIKYGSLSKEKQLLKDKKIEGYIYLSDDNAKIVIKENGINQTIIKYVVDEIFEYERLTTDIVNYNITQGEKLNTHVDVNKVYTDVISKLNSNKQYVNNISKIKMNLIVIEFYTLIAMTCLFGAITTSTVISNYLANINKKGARVTLAPVSRISLILGGLLAASIVQLATVGIVLGYTHYILDIDYGDKFGLVILLSLVGSLAGNILGLLLGSMTFRSENSRSGAVTAVVMLGCFFSGMMGVTMKYVIDKNMPIINIINPANMITDGFYSLYYYSDLKRFYFNIMSLLIFSGILLIISYFLMRRKKYDSI